MGKTVLLNEIEHKAREDGCRTVFIEAHENKALGPGAHRTGDIANILDVKISSLGPVRGKLIRKGMIYSPAYGDMAFTVPLFDEFMIRAMPELSHTLN